MENRKSIIVLCNQRCGSNLFCEYIQAIGCLNASEILSRRNINYSNKYFPDLDMGNYVSLKEKNISFENSLSIVDQLFLKYSCNVKPVIFKFLGSVVHNMIVNNKSNLIDFFNNEVFGEKIWVMIERENKLEQAISLFIALKTGNWTSNYKNVVNVEFNRNEIEVLYKNLLADSSSIQDFITYLRIDPIVFSYENFIENPSRYVNQISNKINIHIGNDIKFTKVNLSKQSNELNKVFYNKYNDI